MQFRINKENETLLNELGIMNTKDFNMLLKEKLQINDNTSSLLLQIANDTAFIVDKIKNKGSEEKKSMSSVWGVKRLQFKNDRSKGGAMSGEGWVEFGELLLQQPYKAIQSYIDGGEYIED